MRIDDTGRDKGSVCIDDDSVVSLRSFSITNCGDFTILENDVPTLDWWCADRKEFGTGDDGQR